MSKAESGPSKYQPRLFKRELYPSEAAFEDLDLLEAAKSKTTQQILEEGVERMKADRREWQRRNASKPRVRKQIGPC